MKPFIERDMNSEAIDKRWDESNKGITHLLKTDDNIDDNLPLEDSKEHITRTQSKISKMALRIF